MIKEAPRKLGDPRYLKLAFAASEDFSQTGDEASLIDALTFFRYAYSLPQRFRPTVIQMKENRSDKKIDQLPP